MYRKLASAVLVASAINAKYALALGLGGMVMHSALNQPLDAEISLSSVGDLDKSQVLITLANQSDFLKAGVDRSFFLSDIKFDVILDGKGGGVVKLRSEKRLNEPYLDFLIEAKWPTGRMLRSYTALVDLPVYADSETATVDLGKGQQSSTSQPSGSSDETDGATPPPFKTLPSSLPVSNTGKPKAYKAPAAASTAAVEKTGGYSGNEYKIQPNETLSSIASKLKPSSQVTLNQTMLAIQKMNPNAFVRNNINLIKAGSVLRVPTDADVRQISSSAASKAVAEQTREWRGVQLDATESSNAPVTQSAVSEEGHLSLISAGSGLANGKDKSVGGLNQKLNATKENLEVSKLENKDLNNRVGALNTQVTQLKRMIELKDAELAALQKKLGKEPVKTGDKAPAAGKPDTSALNKKPIDTKLTPVAVEPEPVASDEKLKETVAKEVEPKTLEPKAEPKKTLAPIEEPAPEPSLFDKVKANPLYIGVVALILIFGVVAFLFRRKAQAERQAMEENDIGNFDFDEAVAETSLDSLNSHEAAEEVDAFTESDSQAAEDHGLDDGQSTVMQTSDPVGEADIYIAYGRYDQAAELLLNAISTSPANIELRTKLLEVYIESKNKAGFQQQYLGLRSLGNANAISHAKELLTSADGVADWLNDLPPEEASVSTQKPESDFDLGGQNVVQDDDFDLDLSAEEEVFSFKEDEPSVKSSEVESNEHDFDLSGMDDISDMDFNLAETVKPAVDANITESDFDADLSLDLSDLESDSTVSDLSFDLDSTSVESQPQSLEDDLSLELDDLSFELSDEIEAKNTTSAQDELDNDSFEESLDFSGLGDLDVVEEPSEVAESSSNFADEDLSFDGFDLDLDEEPVKSVEIEEDTSLDFSDVDLGLDDGSGLVSSEPTIVRNAIDLSLGEDISLGDQSIDDLSATESAFEFDSSIEDVTHDDLTAEEMPTFDEVSIPETEIPVPEQVAHISSPITTLDSEDLEFLTDGDEVSTKLDLAQAYVDLGDIDGARDILLEVMKEGKDAQKAEAAALLDSLD